MVIAALFILFAVMLLLLGDRFADYASFLVLGLVWLTVGFRRPRPLPFHRHREQQR